MTDDEKQQMFAELLEAARPRSRKDFPQPNITSREYAKLKGISVQAAYDRLESACQQGRMEKGTDVHVDDHLCNVYWKA
jgi:hypothetical protein